MSDSLRPNELLPARLLCPWTFPGKNTGVGCHFLLQGIFLTQGSNPCLLHLRHCQADSLPLSHLGSHSEVSAMSHWRDNSTNKCPPPSLGLHTQHSPDSMEITPHLNAISEKTGLKWPWGGLDEVSAPGEIRTLSGKKVSYIFFFFNRLCVLRLLLAVFILLLITLKDLRPSFSNSQQAGSLAQCSVMT